MAARYAKAMQVPEGFPSVLRDFAREALRLQGKMETRDAIYEFGLQYFKDASSKQRKGESSESGHDDGLLKRGEDMPTYKRYSQEEVNNIVDRFFDNAYNTNDGLIRINSLKHILEELGQKLQLSNVELCALYAEADQTEEGFVQLEAFLPLAKQALVRLRTTLTARRTRTESLQAKMNDEDVLLHGMMQDEMESLLQEVFSRSDPSNSGVLLYPDFMGCLQDMDLGLSRREVNALAFEAHCDEANNVSYLDFVPLCFPMLKAAYLEGVLETPNDQDMLLQYLMEVFAGGDSEVTGLLSINDLVQLFHSADLGLTRLQIAIILSEAEEDKSGFIPYQKFLETVIGMVQVLVSFDSQQHFSSFLRQYRSSSDFYTVLGTNQLSFEQSIADALEPLDEEKRGLLSKQEVTDALRSTFPDMTHRQVRTVLSLSEVDEVGDVEYSSIVHSAFPALQKLQEYDQMINE